MRWEGLWSPVSGRGLEWDSEHSLAAAGERWPVVEGIPFLRADRRELADDVLGALDGGDAEFGVVMLLGDQDPWARTAPPSEGDRRRLVRGVGELSFREAMELLAFGAVGTYFAHRWSDPTFLSGLALAEAHWSEGGWFELACGAGHFLREFGRKTGEVAGGDIVFAKLWLARRYLAPGARLICFDAGAGWPFGDGAFGTVFCHDAFYFLPRKDHVAGEMRRVGERVLVGHAHNALVDNLSAGEPMEPLGYAGLFPGAVLYDDRELTGALVEARAPCAAGVEALAGVAAVSLAFGAGEARPVEGGVALPPVGAVLRRNPLYQDSVVRWPSPRYAAEYGGLATYPERALGPEVAVAGSDAVVDRLARVRGFAGFAGVMVKLGWGIAGCGWVARDYVAPAIQASANGRLVGVYDPSAVSRHRAGQGLGVPAFDSLEAFLAAPGLEAVYVAAPNHAHRALVEAAAGAGLPVLCEKPMATTMGDAEAMVEACRRAGVRYATAFDQRFHAAHRTLAGLVADGTLGTVTAVRIVYACWLPADWAGDNWRIDPGRAGGGALMDLAPHGLDLSAYLLGEPLVEVMAMGQARVHHYKVEDGALLMARSRSGAMVQMHVAYNCPETLPRRRLEVVGTAGMAVAVDTMGQTAGGTLEFIDAATGVAAPVAVAGGERSPFLNQVEAFAASVAGNGVFPFSPEGDLLTMRLVLEAQRMALPPGHAVHAA